MYQSLKWLALWASFLSSGHSSAADLTIKVLGVKNNNGNVHFALFNDPKTFPYNNGVLKESQVSIKNKTAFLNFLNLMPGLYAVAVYHDENDNNQFDQNFLGIPIEDFGFSKNVKVLFSPPNFTDAQFLIKKEHKEIIITLNP